MPLESRDRPPWHPPRAGRLAAGADTAQVAETVLLLWAEIVAVLHPIVGHRGVAALYNRSLSLSTVAHPWLPSDPAGLLAALDLVALRTAMLQQTAAEAGAAADTQFRTFHTQLANLVGGTLTERLLGAVWAPAAPASPVPPSQDSPT
jgi:hypothetical protein